MTSENKKQKTILIVIYNINTKSYQILITIVYTNINFRLEEVSLELELRNNWLSISKLLLLIEKNFLK